MDVRLSYNVAYHLHCQLALHSGRTITLEALDQRMTYAGLLEGTPDAKTNNWDIDCALRESQRSCVSGAKPHLLPPPRRNHLREPGDMGSVLEGSSHRVPQWLPMVRCIGSFKSIPTVRETAKDMSVLVVVWFQDEYAPPICEPAMEQLLAMDWESLATDLSF